MPCYFLKACIGLGHMPQQRRLNTKFHLLKSAMMNKTSSVMYHPITPSRLLCEVVNIQVLDKFTLI